MPTDRVVTPFDPLPEIVEDSTPAKKAVHVVMPEVSDLCAANVISDNRRQIALIMWETLHKKITRIPLDTIVQFEPEARKIIHAISETGVANLAHLEEFIGDYFQKVETYNNLQSPISSLFFNHKRINLP